MNDSILLSICVPIYGTQKYIERCARSLFEQDIQDVEYIFVNDCTKDAAIDVLKNVVADYPNVGSRVKIINHETNKGLAGARLTGLQNATGEYVWCVDSDDYVDKRAIEVLFPYMLDNYDFISFNYFLNDGQTLTKFLSKSLSVKNFLMNRIPPSIWKCVVKKDLYVNNDIWPVVGINVSEDYLLTARLILVAQKKILLDKEFLYYYNISNLDSYMNNMKESSFENCVDSALIIYDFYRNKEKLFLYKKQLAYMLAVNYMRLIIVNPYNTRCSKLAHLIGELNKTYLMVAKSCLSLSHKMTILRLLTRI